MNTRAGSKKSRKLKHSPYSSFKLQKRVKNPQPKLPSTWQILEQSTKALKANWRFFGGIALIYALFLLVFVRGVSGGFDIVGTKDVLNESLGGGSGLATNLTLFTTLLGTTTSGSNDVASLYQAIIVFLTSLAIIWGLRQLAGKGKTVLSVKDAFYKGMYPLVPALLVLLVIALQLLPLTLASGLYGLTISSGLAVTPVEQLLWLALCLLLATLSFYMISSSLFAFYIVTLPDIKPMQALRSARKLVLHRRFLVLRKLLLFGIILLLGFALIILPLIVILPVIAEFILYILFALALPLFHAFVYNLYKALL